MQSQEELVSDKAPHSPANPQHAEQLSAFKVYPRSKKGGGERPMPSVMQVHMQSATRSSQIGALPHMGVPGAGVGGTV